MGGLPVKGKCGQIIIPNEASITNYSAKFSPSPNCDPWMIVGCGAAAAGAGAACGELGPATVACISAAVGSIAGCGACLCSTVSCPDWCPCSSSDVTSLVPSSFKFGL